MEAHKRMLVFIWSDYDMPNSGGLNDLVGSFDTLQESIDKVNEEFAEGILYDHARIYDRIEGVVVWQNDRNAMAGDDVGVIATLT